MKQIRLFQPTNSIEMERNAIEVLRSGSIASGAYVGLFESGFSRLVGAKNVVSTIDMTSAIHLALHLSNVKAGDEVITNSFSCLSTNSPIAALGAVPVWADVIPETVFIGPSNFEELISEKTKAVIVYHVAGYPGQIEKIANICAEHKIFLIEDCNNALLATSGDQIVGSFGDFAIYSFYPNRQINAGEGGALVCKSVEHVNRARKLRRFGIDANNFRKENGEINPSSDVEDAGWSYTMNNLCASLAEPQIKDVFKNVDKARINASVYVDQLKDNKNVKPIQPLEGSLPSYWTFLVNTKNKNQLIQYLKEKSIPVSGLHQNNHKYSCFRSHPSQFLLPNVEHLQDSLIGLPCGWWMEATMLEYICDALKKFEKKFVN